MSDKLDKHSEYIPKSHNVSVLLYHLVCPTKYRRAVVTEPVDLALRHICTDIENRYEIVFLEIGADKDHARVIGIIEMMLRVGRKTRGVSVFPHISDQLRGTYRSPS